jgi:hypothetical protein
VKRARAFGICALGWLVGGGALNGCGGSGPSTPFTPAPTPTPTATAPTLADLSAFVSSPQVDSLLACRQDVIVRATLTNRAARQVSVLGLRRTTRTVSGGCVSADHIYRFSGTVGAAASQALFEGPLYAGGSGCCRQTDSCDGAVTCEFEQTFTILTDVGEVPAGSFQYRVIYLQCVACPETEAASRAQCAPPSP